MSDLTIRPATTEDITAIVAMLADDVLGATRESPDDLEPYLAAFAVIDADPQRSSWSPNAPAASSARCS